MATVVAVAVVQHQALLARDLQAAAMVALLRLALRPLQIVVVAAAGLVQLITAAMAVLVSVVFIGGSEYGLRTD